MFNAWNVLPKRCNHDCLPPPSWKQRARDYMKKKMEFLIFWIFPKSTETSRHVQIFSFFFFSSSYRRQSINISRIRKASRPTTGNPPPSSPSLSPIYYGSYFECNVTRKKQNKQKRGMWKDLFLQKAASRFHLIIICQQNTLACLSDVVYSDKQAGRKKKSLNILNHISSSKLWVKKIPFQSPGGRY